MGIGFGILFLDINCYNIKQTKKQFFTVLKKTSLRISNTNDSEKNGDKNREILIIT